MRRWRTTRVNDRALALTCKQTLRGPLDVSGLRVVVENMINETDHDHLGKIITYAAGLEATYAVLIAEKFRPEHRSALQWLNVHSTESAGFFGVTLKRLADWRFGICSPTRCRRRARWVGP